MKTEFAPATDCTYELLEQNGVEYIGKQPDCPLHGFEAHLKASARPIVETEGDNPPLDMRGSYKRR